MIWTRSETVALAKESCYVCRGQGLKPHVSYFRKKIGARKTVTMTKDSTPWPCDCVLRAIFRACLKRFYYESRKEAYMTHARLARRTGVDTHHAYERRDEDYCADFFLVSRRNLLACEWQIFSKYFLLGMDWRACCGALGLGRGEFFHSVYRIQHKLGRVYRELEPYSLYPLSDYFGGKKRKAASFPGHPEPHAIPVRAPLEPRSMAARAA